MRQSLRIITLVLSLGAALLGSRPASAACVVRRFATLDVTMENGLPITRISIGGHAMRMAVASGAFYSFVTNDAARAAGLTVKAIPLSFDIRQNGAAVNVGRTFVEELKFSDTSAMKGVNFLVGGSHAGLDGTIGQNLLGRRDAEYDLAHGAVRLAYSENCLGQIPVYWAGAASVMSLPIETMDTLDQHTFGTVLVNGVKVRAMFDSGATASTITRKTATKLGIAPDGVSPLVKLDTVEIGGETLRGATIQVEDGGRDQIDMTIGLDFFLAHRIYVGNGLRRMFFTYNGGPVWGVQPVQAQAASPATQ